jgi:hypothetical protein
LPCRPPFVGCQVYDSEVETGAVTGYGDNPTILSETPVPVNAFMIATKPIVAMH